MLPEDSAERDCLRLILDGQSSMMRRDGIGEDLLGESRNAAVSGG